MILITKTSSRCLLIALFTCFLVTHTQGSSFKGAEIDRDDADKIFENEEELYLSNFTTACPYENDWEYSYFSHSCVKLFKRRLNFLEALKTCRERHGRLLEINDKYEEVVIKKMFEGSNIGAAWIGALRGKDGETVLLRGKNNNRLEPTPYSNFADASTNYGCAIMRRETFSNGTELEYWKAIGCEETKAFFCEKKLNTANADDYHKALEEQLQKEGQTQFESMATNFRKEDQAEADILEAVDAVYAEDRETAKALKEAMRKVFIYIRRNKRKGKGGNVTLSRSKRSTYDSYSTTDLCLIAAELASISSLTMDSVVSCT